MSINNFVIFGSGPGSLPLPHQQAQNVSIYRYRVRCGLAEASQLPAFDPHTPENRNHILLKTAAFSMNYRDMGLLLRLQLQPRYRHACIGSDFVAEVVAVGDKVQHLKPGDRVIGNNHYEKSYMLENGARAGVAANIASKRFRITHAFKVVKIPEHMPDEIAGGFSINAQTAYSIVRKAKIKKGQRVLVTSAKSNTALSCINALRKTGAQVYAMTTSHQFTDRFYSLGVHKVISPSAITEGSESENPYKANLGFFDSVIDPFFNLHLPAAVTVLAPFGSYYTCGLVGDFAQDKDTSAAPVDMHAVMTTAIMKNLNICGNCLGLTQDLEQAVEDYAQGAFDHVVDSVYSAGQEGAFLTRTYMDRTRFGKVVYQYTGR